MFLYGKERNKEFLIEKALEFLNLIPAENNKTTKNFGQEGLVFKSAFQTQALIQLKTKYCDTKKCLECPIGNLLLK